MYLFFHCTEGLPLPELCLPNEVLISVVEIFRSLPPLSLNNPRTISTLSQSCLDQGREFLKWILAPSSGVDKEGRRLALEISLLLTLHEGSLASFISWIASCFTCLTSFMDVGGAELPHLSQDLCQFVVKEIQQKTVSTKHQHE